MTMLERPSLTVEIPLILRVANKTDLPKLEWHGRYIHYRNLFYNTFVEQKSGKRLMLLADSNGFPIGHIFIQFPQHNRQQRNYGYLYAFRVMEMFQGRGIGTWLMHEAEKLLMHRGYDCATLAVDKVNEGALRLYQRIGYQIYAEDDGEWSYRDHLNNIRYVSEPCWLLEKSL